MFNCLKGSLVLADKYPFIIGSDTDVDHRIESPTIAGKHCQIVEVSGKPMMVSLVSGGMSNGKLPVPDFPIEPGKDHAMVIGSQCFYVRYGKDARQWGERLAQGGWVAAQNGKVITPEPQPLPNLLAHFHSQNIGTNTELVLASQHSNMGFAWQSLAPVRMGLIGGSDGGPQQPGDTPVRGQGQPNPPAASGVQGDSSQDGHDPRQGEFTCPNCLEGFNKNDILWVAVHPELKIYDPLLETEALLRFKPRRFSGRLALDPKGRPCKETACPHCHIILPQSMFVHPQYIISNVGDAASGKSYFLSVMTHELRDSMTKYFGHLYEDETPEENLPLNDMVTGLFGASEINQVPIAKTTLDGKMYREMKKDGAGQAEAVRMPLPFTFSVSPGHRANRNNQPDKINLVFYDNAGEHFQASNQEKSGATHVAAASGIMFMFDPFNHIKFKKILKEHHRQEDPQILNQVVEKVPEILREMKKRIQDIHNTPRLKAPLAFICGKYDSWHDLDLLPKGYKFYECREKGVLNTAAIQHNSEQVKAMLTEICPGIVEQAESLSENTMFFPVSSFGTAPIKVEKRDGTNMIVPDPGKLNPMFVDVPVLWLISQFAPQFVPSS